MNAPTADQAQAFLAGLKELSIKTGVSLQHAANIRLTEEDQRYYVIYDELGNCNINVNGVETGSVEITPPNFQPKTE
jgi:hypothetical protein